MQSIDKTVPRTLSPSNPGLPATMCKRHPPQKLYPACRQGALRIAHCGGFHSEFNVLVKALNVVAKLLGHPIHWDTETVGCNPSLSSIPVTEQRTFKDALMEISAWLDAPANAHEFVLVYLDDQIDLSLWVRDPAPCFACLPAPSIMMEPEDHILEGQTHCIVVRLAQQLAAELASSGPMRFADVTCGVKRRAVNLRIFA